MKCYLTMVLIQTIHNNHDVNIVVHLPDTKVSFLVQDLLKTIISIFISFKRKKQGPAWYPSGLNPCLACMHRDSIGVSTHVLADLLPIKFPVCNLGKCSGQPKASGPYIHVVYTRILQEHQFTFWPLHFLSSYLFVARESYRCEAMMEKARVVTLPFWLEKPVTALLWDCVKDREGKNRKCLHIMVQRVFL